MFALCNPNMTGLLQGVPPERERQTREGWVDQQFFLSLSVNISKTVTDTAKVTIND